MKVTVDIYVALIACLKEIIQSIGLWPNTALPSDVLCTRGHHTQYKHIIINIILLIVMFLLPYWDQYCGISCLDKCIDAHWMDMDHMMHSSI